MKLLKRFSPASKLRELMPDLLKLRVDLADTQRKDPLEGIIKFFDLVSRWYDRGLDDIIEAFQKTRRTQEQYEDVIEKLRVLATHFKRAGRDNYGMNRSGPGERVTANDVYLGNIYGLFTRPIPVWEKGKNEKRYDGRETCYDIVSIQASDFMSSHVEPMMEIILFLETRVAI